MQAATLVLRDIHQTAAPPWWPPAPGWWLLAAVLLLAIVGWSWYAARRRRYWRSVAAVFDDTLRAAPDAAAEVAAMSELLRRAARRRDPSADRLQGEAWLQFLDAAPPTDPAHKPAVAKPVSTSHGFTQGPGRLLLEGGYRREVDPARVAELRPLVRARFLEWMVKP
ncbi:MAG TPA: DUF4381 family protein [Lysobacter sp.]|nr:DUF4381 family protein [Lysobacter sp.]